MLAKQLRFDNTTTAQTQVAEFGAKFEKYINVTGENGNFVPVLTVWIVRVGEDFARFVTTYGLYIMIYNTNDVFKLSKLIPDAEIPIGTVGVVLLGLCSPEGCRAYEVEFCARDGRNGTSSTTFTITEEFMMPLDDNE